VEVEMAVPAPPQERASGKTFIAFDNMVPKVVSFHSAKGLTFDSVLLPCLSKEAFGLFEEGIRTRMLFVGIARAMRWAYLSTVQNRETPELARLHEAETKGHLEVQKGGEAKARPQRPKEEEEYSVL
jgi:superfamily I DNA/RNA helicase